MTRCHGCLPIGLILLGAIFPAASPAAPRLLVSPGIAASGDDITVRASGLKAWTSGRLTVRRGRIRHVRRLRVDGSGALGARIDVPQGGARRALVELRAGRVRLRYRLPVTRRLESPSSVAWAGPRGRRLLVRPAEAMAMETVRVTGAGFRPGKRVRLPGAPPGRTGWSGRFDLRFTARLDMRREATLGVRVGRTRARLPFRIADTEPGFPGPRAPGASPADGAAPAQIVVPSGLREAEDPVLVAVGDIACAPGQPETPTTCRQAQTAAVTAAIGPDAIALPGDIQYEGGSYEDFMGSFDQIWGRFRSLWRPAPGNHEYVTEWAAGYFQYFGAAAGDPRKGYYSYDLGRWHVVVLNTNYHCRIIACGPGSAQERWLREDLAAHPAPCVLAYWHQPLFSNGTGETSVPRALWQALYDAGADLVLAGHDHSYERLAPMNADGVIDPGRGMRSFVVGTGGKVLYPHKGLPTPATEIRDNRTYGVLGFVLRPTGYDWYFVPEAGGTFIDEGSAGCH